ncbi:NAD-P-binding protein [Amylostereum chailletii]|nr:NAD-P-binding protein [Amylostereum chailletii]
MFKFTSLYRGITRGIPRTAAISPTLLRTGRNLSSGSFPRGAEREASSAPLAPLGLAAAYAARANPREPVRPKILSEFVLTDRVALVTGANRGLGLEMALALSEAGCRAVYCVDLPSSPGEDFEVAREYVQRMDGGGRRLEYVKGDVADQKGMWAIGEMIGEKEGRMDIGLANAGVLKPVQPCLEYDAKVFEEVFDINCSGVLYTAQAVGRQMEKFKTPGSIILLASMSGTIVNQGQNWISYNTSKAAVVQMARNMACELGPQRIRVNSLSPGHIHTKLTEKFLEGQPELYERWTKGNPLGRLGRPDELRGVITWLASDASTYCTGSDILVDGGHHIW